jgi:hypothetical protein
MCADSRAESVGVISETKRNGKQRQVLIPHSAEELDALATDFEYLAAKRLKVIEHLREPHQERILLLQ